MNKKKKIIAITSILLVFIICISFVLIIKNDKLKDNAQDNYEKESSKQAEEKESETYDPNLYMGKPYSDAEHVEQDEDGLYIIDENTVTYVDYFFARPPYAYAIISERCNYGVSLGLTYIDQSKLTFDFASVWCNGHDGTKEDFTYTKKIYTKDGEKEITYVDGPVKDYGDTPEYYRATGFECKTFGAGTQNADCKMVISDEIDGHKISSMKDTWYTYVEPIKYEISSNVEFLEELAIHSEKIESFTVPDSIKYIDTEAIHCYSMRDIYVGENVEIIGENGISGAEGLTIHTKKGSAAYNYAIANGFKVVEWE